jgi:hypothetical protein
MDSSILWYIMPRSPLKNNRCFGGTYRINLQDRRISQTITHREAGSKPCRPFDPENGGDMLFRNIGWISADYKALYPRRSNSSKNIIYRLMIRWLVNNELEGMQKEAVTDLIGEWVAFLRIPEVPGSNLDSESDCLVVFFSHFRQIPRLYSGHGHFRPHSK